LRRFAPAAPRQPVAILTPLPPDAFPTLLKPARSSAKAQSAERRWLDALLAWYFVTVWGSGFLATKVGLQYAAPFTFLTLRFVFGIACLVPIVLITRPRWPTSGADIAHAVVAGLLMHAIYLGGSHYTQYLGVSAGITAVLLSAQPLLTALVASRWMGELLTMRQWVGIGAGLAGVVLVVWHKIDIREMTVGSLLAMIISLFGVTAGTLYQRVFCPVIDLRAAALVQFVATLIVLAPLAWLVEGFRVQWAWQMCSAIVFLVIGASLLAVSALHALMRRGQATRVTSLLYLTPIFAVVLEFAWFDVVPTPVSIAGIAVTCTGVALVAWRRPATTRGDEKKKTAGHR
jgi:drug/metabolite transporter (DMT)-like permease